MKLNVALALAVFTITSVGLSAEPSQPTAPRAWAMPDRELMVSVEGGRVWVSVNGDLEANGAPVIFIHGGPGGTHAPFGGLTALAGERAVILYDQLDSGMSDHPGDPANWRVARFVGELESIRKALGIERWHVFGHSWGAAIALEYSAAYPDRVVSTVLAGPFLATSHGVLATSLLVRDLAPEVQRDIFACESDQPPPEERCKAAVAAFNAAYNGRPDAPPLPPEAIRYRELTRGKGRNPDLLKTMWGPSDFSARGTLLGYDATPLLTKLDGNRTLFVVGQHDSARLDTVRDFARLIPGAELAVVPGASHRFFSERPIETEGIARGWLSRKDVK